MNNKVKWYASIVLLVGVVAFAIHEAYEHGIKAGINAYHSQCFDIGGFIIHPETGKAVRCAPLGVVPKEELKNYKESL